LQTLYDCCLHKPIIIVVNYEEKETFVNGDLFMRWLVNRLFWRWLQWMDIALRCL